MQSVQSLSGLRCFAAPWTEARQASPSITNSQSLGKLRSIELLMPSNHLILCYALLLLPSIFSGIRVFSNESALRIRWPKYWSFSFSISPSNEYSGLISFRMDCLDLLVVQGTLKSFLQHHSSKASILQLLVIRQISSRDVMYNGIIINIFMLYIKVDSKSWRFSSQENFFLFYFVPIWDNDFR